VNASTGKTLTCRDGSQTRVERPERTSPLSPKAKWGRHKAVNVSLPTPPVARGVLFLFNVWGELQVVEGPVSPHQSRTISSEGPAVARVAESDCMERTATLGAGRRFGGSRTGSGAGSGSRQEASELGRGRFSRSWKAVSVALSCQIHLNMPTLLSKSVNPGKVLR